tara:strand:+ start:3710 stop:4546 length:837 start_codon:yes stop_codon:yes gene_type:complete
MARRQLYRRSLQKDLTKTFKAQQEEYEKQQKQAAKEGSWGGIGGTLGGLIGQFGTPALLGLLGVSTGGLAPGVLLALSAVGAAAGSYLGSKAGEELTPGQLSSEAITGGGSGLAKGSLKEYKTEVNKLDKALETQRQTSALKTGASVAAQGITMGADKYAAYAKNPLGHYLPSMRNKEQWMYAGQDAVKGLAPGTAEYDAALQSAGIDMFQPIGDSMATMPKPDSLLSMLPSPDITAMRLPREAVNLNPTASAADAIPDDALYSNLLQATRNPYNRLP